MQYQRGMVGCLRLLVAVIGVGLVVGCTAEAELYGESPPCPTSGSAVPDSADVVLDAETQYTKLEPGAHTIHLAQVELTVTVELKEPTRLEGKAPKPRTAAYYAFLTRGGDDGHDQPVPPGPTVGIVPVDVLVAYTSTEEREENKGARGPGTWTHLECPTDPVAALRSDDEAGRYVDFEASDVSSPLHEQAILGTARVRPPEEPRQIATRYVLAAGMPATGTSPGPSFAQFGPRTEQPMDITFIPNDDGRWLALFAKHDDAGSPALLHELLGAS